jgi:hypothetical protein
MDETARTTELLTRMEKNSRYQTWLSLAQCLFSLAAVVCCAVLLVAVLRLLPQMQTVLANLESATRQLAAADLAGMAENVDALMVTGQESLEQTMDVIETLDLEALNKAIEDLASIVEPLAKLAKMFS